MDHEASAASHGNGVTKEQWAAKLRPETRALYADQFLRETSDVAAPLHLSTTFHYPTDPDKLVPAKDKEHSYQSTEHIYSRVSNPNAFRLEALLGSLLGAPTLVYSSGLSASHAIYAVLRPRQVFITGGYHGVHGVLATLHRITAQQAYICKPLDQAETQAGPGDVVHVETPLNPTGEATNLAHYAALAHSRGALCVVDATFAPPPLQDPFALGADIVMHSGTKYIGGHSDLLLGVVATHHKDHFDQLAMDRLLLGCVPGNMEAWLATRSVRSLQVRIRQQSATATELVDRVWNDIHGAGAVAGQEGASGASAAFARVFDSVGHSSVQFRKSKQNGATGADDGAWLNKQMPLGLHGPVFSLVCHTEQLARKLPSKLRLFAHATSLGGVESLIEWRAMSDPTVDTRLMRVSIGLENVDDLYEDLAQAASALIQEEH